MKFLITTSLVLFYLSFTSGYARSNKNEVYKKWSTKEKTEYMRYCMENLQIHGGYGTERAYNRCFCITEHMSLNQPFKRAHLYHVIVSEKFICPL